VEWLGLSYYYWTFVLLRYIIRGSCGFWKIIHQAIFCVFYYSCIKVSCYRSHCVYKYSGFCGCVISTVVILVESTASTKHTQQLCEFPVNCISSAKTNIALNRYNRFYIYIYITCVYSLSS
jgi:hypothetical protein